MNNATVETAIKRYVDDHLAPSARADLFRRLGRREDARAAYEQARGLAKADPEIRYLEKRLRELS